MLALTPFYRHSLYDPFRDFEKLERRFFGDRTVPDFRFDLYEEGEIYVIKADLPGIAKADIDIEIEPPYLTVRATREAPSAEGTDRRYIHSERFYGSFERTFDIAGVDAESVSAAYENGVLTLTMPKKKAESTKKKSIAVE